jgi:hypothetical protein
MFTQPLMYEVRSLTSWCSHAALDVPLVLQPLVQGGGQVRVRRKSFSGAQTMVPGTIIIWVPGGHQHLITVAEHSAAFSNAHRHQPRQLDESWSTKSILASLNQTNNIFIPTVHRNGTFQRDESDTLLRWLSSYMNSLLCAVGHPGTHEQPRQVLAQAARFRPVNSNNVQQRL